VADLVRPEALPPGTASRSRRFAALHAISRDRVGLAGCVLVALALGAALLGPLLAPQDPTVIHPGARLAPPGGEFLLGADELGRDLFSRALYGARISVQVGLVVVVLAGLIGVTIGLMAGYFRGLLDGILMRIMDTLFAFPTLLLALAVVAVLGTDLINLIMALTIVYVPAFARIARGSTLSVSEEPYVEAARSAGASNVRIIVRHILPNITAPITVQFTVSLAYAILVEASLSYLGLGVQPPDASWGSMLATGKPYLEISPWVSIVPGVSIMLTVLGFNLLGDALRDAMDPRLRSREL
jgi:peptide/nickel transport system permease protein